MYGTAYRRARSPSQSAWSEGWRPPGAESAFIKWGELSKRFGRHDRTQNCSGIIIIIITIFKPTSTKPQAEKLG